MEILNWLAQWYASNCDEDWEHEFGVKIITIDNPGWSLKVDLHDTSLQGIEQKYQLFETSEDDWYGITIKDNIFHAAGDPSKLEFLLNKFREFAEANNAAI